MNIETACAYLGAVDREKFLASIAPTLQAVKLPDGGIRYDRQDLDAWVDARGQVGRKRSDDEWLYDISNAKN